MPVAISEDDKINPKCKTRSFSDDSEEYMDMKKPDVNVTPQLQIIAEVEDTGNSGYELPVVGEDELYSYLQLEEEQINAELNDKNVAKLVSQFNKSLEVVCFPDKGRSPSPSPRAKPKNNVHASSTGEECEPLNPRMLTP